MNLDKLIKKYKPHEVDFVFPKTSDTKVYLDLYLLYNSPDQRWHKVHTLIFEYFNYYLTQYRGNTINEDVLLDNLHFPEVPYIALGHCKDGIYGSGTGEDRALVIKDSIFDSEEVMEIGIEALAGTSITIGGWGPDLLSDMIANFGMHHLLEYTNEQVELYDLETAEFQIKRALKLPEFEWPPLQKVKLPIFKDGSPRILVPKHLVKRLPIFTTGGFYDNYLKYLLQEEKGDRVKSIKTIGKSPKVPLTQIAQELKEKYQTVGEATRTIGLERPEALKGYISNPLLFKKAHTKKKKEKIDWEAYKKEIQKIPPGKENARDYADTLRKVFTAMYGEALVNGTLEKSSEDNIFHYDVTFGNAANTSFFTFLRNQQVKAGVIILEAKNYLKTKVSNKELNQANGYGIVGAREFVLMVTREEIIPAHIRKCRRYLLTHKILIIPLSDKDIFELLDNRKNNPEDFDYLLIERAKEILQA